MVTTISNYSLLQISHAPSTCLQAFVFNKSQTFYECCNLKSLLMYLNSQLELLSQQQFINIISTHSTAGSLNIITALRLIQI